MNENNQKRYRVHKADKRCPKINPEEEIQPQLKVKVICVFVMCVYVQRKKERERHTQRLKNQEKKLI